MSQEVWRQELVKQLGKFTGFRGRTAFDVGELITPVANLGDLDGPPFNSKVGGVGLASRAAFAANYSYVGLRYPAALVVAASNKRTVCRFMLLSAGAAEVVRIALVPDLFYSTVLALGASTGPPGSWDSIVALATTDVVQPAAVQAEGVSATSFLFPWPYARCLEVNLAVGQTLRVEGPWSIAPGNTLLLQGSVVNTTLTSSFYWDEYELG